eukprot:6441767-Prymnesium_polylepis.1
MVYMPCSCRLASLASAPHPHVRCSSRMQPHRHQREILTDLRTCPGDAPRSARLVGEAVDAGRFH